MPGVCGRGQPRQSAGRRESAAASAAERFGGKKVFVPVLAALLD